MARFLRAKKPDIRYPCIWLYKIFGNDRESMREAVGLLFPERSYALEPSHSSRNNRYHCMNLEFTVKSDDDRLGIYEALNAHPDILLVL